MKILKKIFGIKQTEEVINTADDKIIPSDEQIDYYANSWVNNDILNFEQKLVDTIYSNDFSEKKVNQFLKDGTYSDMEGSGWNEKGQLNFPGPFYTGETDTCGTGIIEAPKNVIFDEHCQEFVMIQPRTISELIELSNAGAVEVFGEYYSDGNKHWTVQKVKDWWKNKNELIHHLKNSELVKINCNQNFRYTKYLETLAYGDLRRYCFFLDNGNFPIDIDEKMPEI